MEINDLIESASREQMVSEMASNFSNNFTIKLTKQRELLRGRGEGRREVQEIRAEIGYFR